MQKLLIISTLIIFCFSFCNPTPTKKNIKTGEIFTDSILKLEMHLSAFGVESDDFPSIDAHVDFTGDSGKCVKSYYNPAYKDSTYYLTHSEIKKVLNLLAKTDLNKLKNSYTVGLSDQPTSTIIVYSKNRTLTIKDYGLQGEYPLQALYKIVYKL
jgi:hypothetical protein